MRIADRSARTRGRLPELRRQSVRARSAVLFARTHECTRPTGASMDFAALYARAGEIVYEALRKLGAASSLTFIG